MLIATAPGLCAENPTGSDAQLKQATDLRDHAGELLARGQFVDAINEMEKAITLAPNDAAMYYCAGLAQQQFATLNVGNSSEHRDTLQKAEKYFEDGLKLSPTNFNSLIHIANVQAELGKYKESLQHLQTALALPGIPEREKQQTQFAIGYVSGRMAAQARLQSTASAGAGSSPGHQVPPQGTALQGTALQGFAPQGTALQGMALQGMALQGMAPQGMAPQGFAPQVPMTREQQMAAMMQAGSWQRMTAPGLPPTPFSGYVQFVDPTEHSFEVEVPAGWTVKGGLTRASAIDCRPWVRVTSPDNLVTAFIGDGKIAPATMPTPLLTSLGYGPGRFYGGGQVLSYIPARKFAEKYANLTLKPYTKDLRVIDEANHPDIAQAVNGTVGATRSECASIKLQCTIKNIPAIGYYLAATKASVQANSGMWWCTYIAGEICPADREAAGLSVLAHMMQTFQLDPTWRQQSLQTTAAVSSNYRAAANAMSKSITDRYWSQQAFNDRMNQSYWNRQAVQDHAANNFSDYMRNQQTVADPQTGTQYKVDGNPAQHWIDPGGNIMGTTGASPGAEWRQLNNVP